MVVGIDPKGIEMETLLQLLKGRGRRKRRTGVETPAQRQNRLQQEIREAEERARLAGKPSTEESRPKGARVGVLTPEQQALRESPLTPEQQALANQPVVFNPIVTNRPPRHGRGPGRQRAGRIGVTASPPSPVEEPDEDVEQIAEESEPITGLQPFVNQKDPTWLNRFKQWFT